MVLVTYHHHPYHCHKRLPSHPYQHLPGQSWGWLGSCHKHLLAYHLHPGLCLTGQGLLPGGSCPVK